MISPSKPPARKEITVDKKTRSNVYFLSVGTRAIATPEKHIPRKNRNMKSLAMLTPRRDPIPNQDINILSTKKDQSLPPQLAEFPPGFKSLINKAEDDYNCSTDT